MSDGPRTKPLAPVEVNASDVLHRAADLLEEFGWCQNDEGSNKQGQMCILGSVSEAARDLGVDEHVADSWVYRAFEDLVPEGLVARWNDRPCRTKAEVVAKLHEAAEVAR